MSTSDEPKRNPLLLPGLTLWGFTPAIFIATSIIGGWSSGEGGISPEQSFQGDALLLVGIFGMPIILYPWCVTILKRFGNNTPSDAAALGIPLTFVMCAVNLFVGATGCTALSDIIPKEGIF